MTLEKCGDGSAREFSLTGSSLMILFVSGLLQAKGLAYPPTEKSAYWGALSPESKTAGI